MVRVVRHRAEHAPNVDEWNYCPPFADYKFSHFSLIIALWTVSFEGNVDILWIYNSTSRFA